MKSLLSMRPFQIVLLALFVVFAVVGLFLFANFSGFNNGSAKIGSVTVWGTLPQSAIQTELNALVQSDKSYNKVTYMQQSADNFDQNLANAIASGNGPDLLIMSQERLMTELNKIDVIPFSKSLSQRTFLDIYVPEDNLFLTTTGVYGVPFVIDPLVLYYNKDILTTGGVALPPLTWEGITGLAPTLTHIGDTQSIAQSTVALGTYENIANARGVLSLLLMQAGNPIAQNTSSGVVSTLTGSNSSSGGATPSVSALNFYTQFSDPSRTVYSWNASFDSDRQQFLSGNLAFYIGYASEQPLLQSANPNLNFDMAQIPQPQTAAQRVDYAQAYAFVVPKASKNPVGAEAAALALANAKFVPGAAQALSMAPAQRALLGTSPTDVYSPIFYPLALISQGWLSPAPVTTDGIFSAMITNITSGRYTVSDAVSIADQALNAAFGR